MQDGIQTITSRHSVDDVVSRLQALLLEKNIQLFALIDHSGEAQAVGLDMPPTKLLIFGNPRGGTPLMQAAPSTALDLPLKILVAQQPGGKTLLSWNSPVWLQQRHGFPKELQANIAAVEILVNKVAE